MFTYAKLAPQACSARTAAAENPHCGKSGVPFMYSSTGLELSWSLIRSMTSTLPHLASAVAVAPETSIAARLCRSVRVHFAAANRQPREPVDDGPLLDRAHASPTRDLVDRAQTPPADVPFVENTDVDAGRYGSGGAFGTAVRGHWR